MKKIAILGSTGSIGTQTLEVARENGDLQITALAAGNNIELLEKVRSGNSPPPISFLKSSQIPSLLLLSPALFSAIPLAEKQLFPSVAIEDSHTVALRPHPERMLLHPLQNKNHVYSR